MQPFTATRDLISIDLMQEHIRRAWAFTNKCDAVGDCSESPTHFLIYRGRAGKRTRRLACTAHAQQAAEKSGITITEADNQ